MPFYLPRRHRRRLLLPPGLLALAGLLLLGCLALRPWQERLTRPTVIELRMLSRPHKEFSKAIIGAYVPDPDAIRTQYSWHDFKLTGIPGDDFRQQQQIAAQLQVLLPDTMHSNGLRIQLEPTAHYASIVYLLDLMLRKHARKYWFDITRKPTTFYIIQDAYRPPDPAMILLPFSCLLCGDVINIPEPPLPVKSFWIRFDNQVTEFWTFQWLAPLKQPEWRWPLTLLTFLFLLSIRRLLARTLVARNL